MRRRLMRSARLAVVAPDRLNPPVSSRGVLTRGCQDSISEKRVEAKLLITLWTTLLAGRRYRTRHATVKCIPLAGAMGIAFVCFFPFSALALCHRYFLISVHSTTRASRRAKY